MRQGQQNSNINNKRMRGRNRKGPNPLTRSFESNGGDVKIRGTALHVAEKYVQLARDAQSSGDRVAAEHYLQHAEHYYRIVAAAQAQMPQPQPVYRSDEEGDEDDGQENRGANGTPQQPGQQPAFGQSDPQPYVNGSGDNDPDDDGGPDHGDNRFEPRDMAMMREPQNSGDQGNYNRGPSENRGPNQQGGGYNANSGNNRGPNDQGGGFRGRRRRPFRERHGEQRDGNTAPAETQSAPQPAPETPKSE
jgi:hypothetical protein